MVIVTFHKAIGSGEVHFIVSAIVSFEPFGDGSCIHMSNRTYENVLESTDEVKKRIKEATNEEKLRAIRQIWS